MPSSICASVRAFSPSESNRRRVHLSRIFLFVHVVLQRVDRDPCASLLRLLFLNHLLEVVGVGEDPSRIPGKYTRSSPRYTSEIWIIEGRRDAIVHVASSLGTWGRCTGYGIWATIFEVVAHGDEEGTIESALCER